MAGGAAAAGALIAPHTSAGELLQSHDIEAGTGRDKRRARLLVPTSGDRSRLLILLHGKGETASESLGLKAWSHLYGLVQSFERLRRPPVKAVLERPRIDERRLARLNLDLAARPFRGFVVVCPTTPYPGAASQRSALFDSYTAWLLEALVPKVASMVDGLGQRIGLDGCSMGGYVALEVLARASHAFDSFGTVQSAIGSHRVPGYVERFRHLARVEQQLPLHLQTSTHDPFREANELLSAELLAAGVDNSLDVIPGHHDQHWLRQIGTLEMLHWHDRHL